MTKSNPETGGDNHDRRNFRQSRYRDLSNIIPLDKKNKRKRTISRKSVTDRNESQMTLIFLRNSWRDTYAIESDISTDLIEYLGRIIVKDTKSVWKKVLSNSKSHELNEIIKSLMMIVYGFTKFDQI